MSFVVTEPQALVAAAGDMASLGSAISAANAAAVPATTRVLAAAGDEVSVAIVALFDTHAHNYQAISAQATAFHTPQARPAVTADRFRSVVIGLVSQ